MRNKVLKLTAAVSSILLAASFGIDGTPWLNNNAAYAADTSGNAVMEYLDRGIYAVKAANGMFVSWRYNADDSDDAEFRLYHDNNLIYTSKTGNATSYLDKSGSTASKYRVDKIENGKVVSSDNCRHISGSDSFDIKLNRPGSQYTPNDCCVGDVDGDGQYEIFLKWDPSNAKDNSQEGKTDKVYIDCYTLDGKQLWRIDMGQNIRAGQHYTQMCVADFDCDGKAELITKTADGTKDGTGKTIGDGSKNYANGKGYILDGPEYLTLFEGKTGKALDTIDFPVPRGKVSDWGDNYGNRVDRFNGGIAYLDGVHPSAIYGRGYYTRLTWSAIDVRNGKLVKRWIYDSGKNGAYANGNHNVMTADVDNDGKQEIFTGAACIDDNGKLLWVNGKKHGDAMHLGDLDPSRNGLEAWVCHEETHGMSLLDAKTGKILFHVDASGDTGRCCGDNVYAGNKGAELWGAANNNVYNANGNKISGTRPAQNFLIYWDGDLEREILDGTKISKMTAADKISTIYTAKDSKANNSSKSVPCLTADLFGDWREELVMASSDGSKIRIFCTTSETKVRLTTLMHDMQYRTQAACEQSCYNQPPHTSFYLGSDSPLPERPNISLNNTPNNTIIETVTTAPATTTSIPQNISSYNKKFDLGAAAQSGFTSVKAADKYDKNKGYGFSGNNVKDVAAAGKNELSDAVQFTGNTTFDTDVPNGLYKVKVTLGNTSRTSVYMENMLQIVNMTGNNAVDEIILPVTDGQLNIRAAEGKSGTTFSISAIEISKISDNTAMSPTIWLCGDSTVCNYYPLNSNAQAGWGQMLGKYVDSGWYIRNMAASGEYAKGFVEHGNFDCIEKYGKSGDIFIISIGINDSKYYNGDEYKKVVTDMVKRAKTKGIEVILVKQQGRKGDSQLNPLLKSRYFSAQLDRIASEQNCRIIDLFTLWQDYCVSIGGTKADSMYIDNVHPNRTGADKLAELFASQFKNKPSENTSVTTSTQAITPSVTVSDIADGQIYVIKNVNSGLYLGVEGGKAENGANVQQSANTGAENRFKAVSAGNGYFYLVSQLGSGNTYALDINGQKTENGTNIELYTLKYSENQMFKFVKNNDGTYSILTKITGDESCLDVNEKSTEAGANIQQYTYNGGTNQKFTIENINAQPSETTETNLKNNILWGDANCDGKVNMADTVLIMQFTSNPDKFGINGSDATHITAQGLINGDVSGSRDGITNADALSIQKYCLDLIDSLPET